MDILKVSRLAKLSLSQEEQNIMNDSLDNIFHWLDTLGSAEGLTVDHPTQPVMHERSDVTNVSVGTQDLLSNAPQQSYGMIGVPKVVEAE